MPTTTVTEKEITFLETFGFLHLPGYFSDRIDKIMEEHDRIWAEQNNGHFGTPHDFKRKSICFPFIDRSEYLSTLIDDPRLDRIYAMYLGEDYCYTGSDCIWQVGDTQWHSDGSHHPRLKHIKLHLYLDHLTAETGAVRVIPGSHRFGEGYADDLSDKIRKSKDIWGKLGSEIPCIQVENRPGDVILFDSRTKHAAFGGGQCRRMMTINACARFPEDMIEDLKAWIGGAAGYWMEHPYGEIMVNTASPERMVHLEQFLAHDSHLKELAAKNRAEQDEPHR